MNLPLLTYTHFSQLSGLDHLQQKFTQLTPPEDAPTAYFPTFSH